MNYNLFLQNAARSSVIGFNLATAGGCQKGNVWEKPGFGLNGAFACGHETDLSDIVVPEFYEKGKKFAFTVARNQWTPSWMKTYYRSLPDEGYYPASGCICICEKKCFSIDDVFFFEVTVHNDKREEITVDVILKTPLQEDGDVYRMDAVTVPRALQQSFKLDGFVAICNSVSSGNAFSIRIPSFSSKTFCYALSYSPAEKSRAACESTLTKPDVFKAKEEKFNRFMDENAPLLVCDNIDVRKAYYYRWFLIFRALHKPVGVIPAHYLKRHCFYESPFGEWFGCPVGLPVPLQIEETKWMKNPVYTYEHIKNWSERLKCYNGYIQYTPCAIWHIYTHHRDRDILKAVYKSCKDYSLAKVRTDADGLDMLPVTTGSWVTGAEYQPAFYEFAEEPWDWTQDSEGVAKKLGKTLRKIYRLDEIAYTIGNILACAKMAGELGLASESGQLESTALKMLNILKENFWKAHCKMKLQ